MRAASSAIASRWRCGAALRALSLRLGKYGASAAIGLKDRAAYKANLVGEMLSYAIFVFIFSAMWKAVYALPGGMIAGYDRRAATWYFIVAELVMFGASGSFGDMAEQVKTGSLAYGLTRPANFVLFQVSRHLGGSVAILSLLVPLGLALGTAFTGLPASPSPAQLAILPASFALALILNCLIQAALGLTALWVEENAAFYWIYSKLALVLGTLMPIEFLPAGAQAVARWLPTTYVTWAPARIASRFSAPEALHILGVQAAWTAAFLLIVILVFRKGVKHVSIQGG